MDYLYIHLVGFWDGSGKWSRIERVSWESGIHDARVRGYRYTRLDHWACIAISYDHDGEKSEAYFYGTLVGYMAQPSHVMTPGNLMALVYCEFYCKT